MRSKEALHNLLFYMHRFQQPAVHAYQTFEPRISRAYRQIVSSSSISRPPTRVLGQKSIFLSLPFDAVDHSWIQPD